MPYVWGPWIDPGVTLHTSGTTVGTWDWKYGRQDYDDPTAGIPQADVPSVYPVRLGKALHIDPDYASSTVFNPDFLGHSLSVAEAQWGTDGSFLHRLFVNWYGNQTAFGGYPQLPPQSAWESYIPATPADAYDVELESNFAIYAGQVSVRLGYQQRINDSGATATHRWHVAPFTVPDIDNATVGAYEPGALLYDDTATAVSGSTDWFDASAAADSDGGVTIMSHSDLTSVTPPTYVADGTTDTTQASISWTFVEYDYLVRVPKVRFLFWQDEPTGTGFAPPLRLHPRSDGLGLSSAVRVWPPPRSQQRSIRPLPGAYL